MNSFDLERAIALWRRQYRYRGRFLREDLDELERHLRDHIAHLMSEGHTPEQAFQEASRALGEAAGAETEYRKVLWGKLRRRRRIISELHHRTTMLKNYLKVALRTIKRHPGYAFINIFGLAIGMACCLLIGLYVHQEWSYDRFHDNADRIYRVTLDLTMPDVPSGSQLGIVSRPMAQALREDYPDVEHLTLIEIWNPRIKHDGQYFSDDAFYFVEPAFLDIFSFPLLEGDRETALNDPNTLLLTESMRRKYFGDAPALGQTLILNDSLTFTVAGVLADIPTTSHFQPDFLVPQAASQRVAPNPQRDTGWLWLDSSAYLMLKEGADPAAFEAKIRDLLAENYADGLAGMQAKAEVGIEPLTGIHLHSDYASQFGGNGNIRYVYALAAIALFVLLVACINFTNLTTAQSLERAKEVGVRKVAGSSRGALMRQFMTESSLVTLVAVGLGVALAALLLPFFNRLSGAELSLVALRHPVTLLVLAGLILTAGLLAGSYPALVLSRFRPVEVLKGQFKTGSQGGRLRQALVVFQFVMSIALMLGTLTVVQQLRYMRSQDLGFAQDQVLILDARDLPPGMITQTYKMAKDALTQHPGVAEATFSQHIPGRSAWLKVVWPEGLPADESRQVQAISTDYDFVDTYGLDIIAGRNFSDEFSTDATDAVLINETAAASFGWTTDEALGKRIRWADDDELQVVGVFRDYHHFSLKQDINPMLLRIVPRYARYVSLRLAASDIPDVIAHTEATWESLYLGYPFRYFFLDDDFNNQYQSEAQLSRIFTAFATLAILIACLGLFGLAAFTAQQRTKEIGVRKVLGASVPSIIGLLSKNFVGLVALAFLIAAPLTYFGMEQWLQEFAFHIEISWPIFLMAGLTALLVALFTVSYQAIKAALADPVKSLRYE